MVKRENSGHQHFLFFPQFFQKDHSWEKEKCWSPTFSLFPTFSKRFFLEVIKTRDGLVKGEQKAESWSQMEFWKTENWYLPKAKSFD